MNALYKLNEPQNYYIMLRVLQYTCRIAQISRICNQGQKIRHWSEIGLFVVKWVVLLHKRRKNDPKCGNALRVIV